MAKHKWTLDLKIPGGHRYYRDAGTGKVALADDSGSSPESTDDGVLWVDTSRPLSVGTRYAFLPVVTEDGTASHATIDVDAAFVVAAQYGLRVHVVRLKATALKVTDA